MLVINERGVTIGELPDNKEETITIAVEPPFSHLEISARAQGKHVPVMKRYTFRRSFYRKDGNAFDVWKLPRGLTAVEEHEHFTALKTWAAQEAAK